MTDPASRPPLQLRVSVTDRCQLRCSYCMPETGLCAKPREDILRFEEIAAFVQHLQQAFDVRKIRLTGGEPLLRHELQSLVRMLADMGVPDLAITTNGQRLAAAAAALRAAGLRRVNISLDSLDPDLFRRISRGGALERTLDGIDAALAAGLRPVKLNMVVLRGVNDGEVGRVLAFALERGCELRFLELMPIGQGAAMFDSGFVSAEEVRASLAPHFRLEPLPFTCASSARRCRATGRDGRHGTIGFISPCSDPFCAGCTRLRLTADGRVIGCLAREDGFQIRPLLAGTDGERIHAVVRQALVRKRTGEEFAQPIQMVAIGG